MPSRLLFALLSLLPSCAGTRPSAIPATPYVVVLGTAQDGGLPQIGCTEPRCRLAREDPARARMVASLLVVDPRSGKRFLIDATPDLARQVELARAHGAAAPGAPGTRPPLFDGLFLTHAHMGHYAGLLALGKEAYGARGLATHASARMAAFLRENAPWSALVADGALALVTLEPGTPVALAADLEVLPFSVPHREEFSDTLGFLVRGPEHSVLYVPDADRWDGWESPPEAWIARADRAYLDGTFFDDGEVPGRDLSKIPHPFVRASLERFAALPAHERAKIRFVHLNHTNPACDAESRARRAIRALGMEVAAEGELVEL